MKTTERGLTTIRITGSIINFFVLLAVLFLLGISVYALWDSKQIYLSADSAQYTVYKPTAENHGTTFRQLQEINNEVFAWLTVYGTNIDYPVTQGQDNMKYINTNADGSYSLSGSIFLDSSNSMEFTDFNSIIYGHHMAKKTMFGEIGRFVDKEMFDANKYGNLYFDGEDHFIEFFAFIHTDAYNGDIITPNISGNERRQAYIDNIYLEAMYSRDIGVTIDDNLVLLVTCSSGSTNGRDILVGRLADVPLASPSAESIDYTYVCPECQHCFVPCIIWLILHLIIIALLITLIILMMKKRKYDENELEASEGGDY